MADASPPVDPRRYTVRWPVRQYELDQFGHVNNAVYLNWIEPVAAEHVEALGLGQAWALAQDRAWVVREHHVIYRQPLVHGDVVRVTTLPQQLRGVRGTRRTEVHRERDGLLVTEALSDWIWIRASDGRPVRLPGDLLAVFALDAPGPS